MLNGECVKVTACIINPLVQKAFNNRFGMDCRLSHLHQPQPGVYPSFNTTATIVPHTRTVVHRCCSLKETLPCSPPSTGCHLLAPHPPIHPCPSIMLLTSTCHSPTPLLPFRQKVTMPSCIATHQAYSSRQGDCVWPGSENTI